MHTTNHGQLHDGLLQIQRQLRKRWRSPFAASAPLSREKERKARLRWLVSRVARIMRCPNHPECEITTQPCS